MSPLTATLDDFADVEHFICTAPEIQYQQCAQRCRQLIAQPKHRKSFRTGEPEDTNIPAVPNMNELIATGNRTLALSTVRAYQQKVRATLEYDMLCERTKTHIGDLQERTRTEREQSTKKKNGCLCACM